MQASLPVNTWPPTILATGHKSFVYVFCVCVARAICQRHVRKLARSSWKSCCCCLLAPLLSVVTCSMSSGHSCPSLVSVARVVLEAPSSNTSSCLHGRASTNMTHPITVAHNALRQAHYTREYMCGPAVSIKRGPAHIKRACCT